MDKAVNELPRSQPEKPERSVAHVKEIGVETMRRAGRLIQQLKATPNEVLAIMRTGGKEAELAALENQRQTNALVIGLIKNMREDPSFKTFSVESRPEKPTITYYSSVLGKEDSFTYKEEYDPYDLSWMRDYRLSKPSSEKADIDEYQAKATLHRVSISRTQGPHLLEQRTEVKFVNQGDSRHPKWKVDQAEYMARDGTEEHELEYIPMGGNPNSGREFKGVNPNRVVGYAIQEHASNLGEVRNLIDKAVPKPLTSVGNPAINIK